MPQFRHTFQISRNISFWIFLFLLLLSMLGISELSSQFEYSISPKKKPVLLLVSLLIISSVFYILVINILIKKNIDRIMFYGVISGGLLIRLLMISSTPILEDDFYRYLWDGALVAEGINPYSISPQEVKGLSESETPVVQKVKQLAEESPLIMERINHPEIRTIYPMVAQGLFAVSYLIKPWNITAWRFLLLIVDLIILSLLLLILREINMSGYLTAIYWLNPLLAKEIFNSGHMDILLFPFILSSIFFIIKNRFYLGSLALGFATGVKLWPIILIPVMVKSLYGKPRKLILALLIFLTVSVILIYPLISSGFDNSAALINYGQRWEANDALFKLILWISQLSLSTIGIHPGHGQFAARVVVICLLGFWIVLVSKNDIPDNREFVNRALLIIAALFLLSPTQFPWYYTWILPLLVFQPRWSLLLLTVVLPLYYLHYYFDANNQLEIFNKGIVWIEYIPVWILLIREWYLNKANKMIFSHPVE